ncbi:outer membrane lipoprotein carrier protein LolA [bacterium]|nr:outer membrane lipoprotein carrier protein LolA [bacterium]
MKRLPILLFLTLLAFSQTAERVAQKAESRIRTLHSLEAQFTQIYHSSTVSTPLKERGKFYFKKPDLMKWEYTHPEKKIFVYKEGILWSYFPQDNQLIKSDLSERKQEAEILSLLSGKKGLLENYSLQFSPFPSQNEDSHQLKLTPQKKHEYSYILLEINPQQWLIQKAIFFDWAGNKSEFHFKKIKTDVPISKEIFELKVPPHTEIIEYKSP